MDFLLNKFSNRKVLAVSLATVSLFATTVFAVSGGPFTPHETLDPDCSYNDVSGNCYVNTPGGGSGSGTPAGNNFDAQFNDSGAFGADTGIYTYDPTSTTLSVFKS
jgi:hypothetical protein